MKVWKKLSAMALALMMVLALCAPAFASNVALNDGATDATLKGQAGTFEDEDTPITQSKTLNLLKEITAYNPATGTIKAPNISYTYNIAPATVATGTTVTDATNKHNPTGSVTVPVYAGATGATIGTVAWTNSDDLNASSAGTSNTKPIAIDFSSVVFTEGPGVYRYVITETPPAYASSGVTETTTEDTTTGNVHMRYVDVYVRAAETGYNNGSTAAEWDIYGYTCFYNNVSITDTDKGSTAVKTTGFVAGTTNGSSDSSKAIKADSYYTFNVEVSKVVQNDNYAAANSVFPFTVLFTNSVITTNVSIITSIAAKDSSDTAHTASATGFVGDTTNNLMTGVFSGDNYFKGILNIKHNTAVKYIGIPCGTSVEVYETNVFAGLTYRAVTVIDGDTNNEKTDALTATSTTPSAVTQAMTGEAKTNAYESTKAVITTTPNQTSNEHTIEITNALMTISPTGVTLRYAPYLAMLGAGVVALPLTLRKREEEI